MVKFGLSYQRKLYEQTILIKRTQEESILFERKTPDSSQNIVTHTILNEKISCGGES